MLIRLIRELAYERRDIQRTLIDKTPTVVQHIMYLVLDPNNINKFHWMSEVHAFIHDIGRLKNGKKFPKSEFIYEYTYGAMSDMVIDSKWFNVTVKDICEDENIELPKNMKQAQMKVDIVCREYFRWLSSELSTNGVISKEDCRNKLTELIY